MTAGRARNAVPAPWAVPRARDAAPGQPGAAGLAALTAIVASACGVLVGLSGVNALFVCLSLVGCLFILRDFRVGVVLLTLLLPISRSAYFPHAMFDVTGLNPLNLLLAGTLFAWLAGTLMQGRTESFVPRPLLWLYIVPIAAAGLLGARHAGEIARAYYLYEMVQFHDAAGYLRDMVVKPLSIVLYALLLAAAVRRSREPQLLLIPALASVWIMVALVLVFVGTSGASLGAMGGTYSRQFLSPLGMHANELGRLYAIAYALLLFCFAGVTHPGLRCLLLATMGAVVIALALTFSRGAFVGFFLVNLFFILWNRGTGALLLLAVAGGLALLAVPDAVFERILAGHDRGANAISAGRIDSIWIPLLPELLANPLFGSGLGSMMWSDAIRRGAGSTIMLVTHPHNAYLQALLDMGLAGLAALLAYFFHVWRRLRALASSPSTTPLMRGFWRGASVGLLCFLVSGITDSSLTPVAEQSFLWFAIGLMYGQSREARSP